MADPTRPRLSQRLMWARWLGRHEERDSGLSDHVDRLLFRLQEPRISRTGLKLAIERIAAGVPEQAPILFTIALIERAIGLPMHPRTKAEYERYEASKHERLLAGQQAECR